jgi:hypothetical protein
LTYKKALNVYLCLCKHKIYPDLRASFPNWRCRFDFRHPLHLKLRLDNFAFVHIATRLLKACI